MAVNPRERYVEGDLEVRPADGLVLAAGRVLTLSVREFELLCALMYRHGRIVPREELYRAVWKGTMRPNDRSIDVYVHKLRSKLERALPESQFIHTHVGFGYRFMAEYSHPFHKTTTPGQHDAGDQMTAAQETT